MRRNCYETAHADTYALDTIVHVLCDCFGIFLETSMNVRKLREPPMALMTTDVRMIQISKEMFPPHSVLTQWVTIGEYNLGLLLVNATLQ